MAVFSGPTTVKNSLVYHVDPANSRSFQRTSLNLTNISNTAVANTSVENASLTAIATDMSPTKNTLILTNVAQNTTVPSEARTDRRSMRFNSSDVGLPGDPKYLMTGDFTFEFWARFDAGQTTYATFWDYGGGGGVGYKWGVTGAGTYYTGRVYVGPLFQDTDHRDNTWRHYAFVRLGNTATLYVNGSSVATNTNFNEINGVNFGTENRASRSWAVPIGRGAPPYYPFSDNYMVSYVYGIHLSRVAKYGSNFTPSTTYSIDIDTVFSIESPFADTTNRKSIFRNGVIYDTSNLGQFTLDGVNDYIDVLAASTISAPSNNFTYEIWCRPTATHEIDAESTSTTTGTTGQKYAIEALGQASATIAGAGISIGTNGVSVYEHATSYMPPLLVYSGAISSTNISQIVVVYTNKTPSLYINGVLVRTGLTSTRTSVIADLVKIGSGVYGSFAGTIAQVRMYERSLTANEIIQNFNSFRGRYGV